jgi:hypothetical protein
VSPNNIYFGEKKVGILKSFNADASGFVYGKIEMNKNFPLYSNADFFLFQNSTGNQVIDIRIDPTREKKLLDPDKDIIKINIR